MFRLYSQWGAASPYSTRYPQDTKPLSRRPVLASSIFQLSALPRTDLPRFRCHGMPPCSELQSAGSRMSRSAVRDTQMTQQQCGCGKILHCEQLQWTVRGLRLQMPLCLLKFWHSRGSSRTSNPINLQPINQPLSAETPPTEHILLHSESVSSPLLGSLWPTRMGSSSCQKLIISWRSAVLKEIKLICTCRWSCLESGPCLRF